MTWTPQQLATAFNALSPVPATLTAAESILNAQTTTRTTDTSGSAIRGILYVRAPAGQPSSFERIISVASGLVAATGITPPAGYTAAQAITLCQAFASIMSANDPVPMSNAAVNAKIQSDLSVLMGSKLADGKGILWAPNDLTSGDPGDAATLMAQLVNVTAPTWQPPVLIADLQWAQRSGLISASVLVN